MALATKYSVDDNERLLEFGVASIEVLALDDLWTDAVRDNDPAAADIGGHVSQLIQQLQEGCGGVADLLEGVRGQLNSEWVSVLESWKLSEDGAAAIQAYISEKGGLGEAGVAIARALGADLGQEVELLQVKISELDAGDISIGDLRIPTRVAIGVVAICVFVAVALPVATGLALAVGGVVASTLVSGPQPQPI